MNTNVKNVAVIGAGVVFAGLILFGLAKLPVLEKVAAASKEGLGA